LFDVLSFGYRFFICLPQAFPARTYCSVRAGNQLNYHTILSF